MSPVENISLARKWLAKVRRTTMWATVGIIAPLTDAWILSPNIIEYPPIIRSHSLSGLGEWSCNVSFAVMLWINRINHVYDVSVKAQRRHLCGTPWMRSGGMIGAYSTVLRDKIQPSVSDKIQTTSSHCRESSFPSETLFHWRHRQTWSGGQANDTLTYTTVILKRRTAKECQHSDYIMSVTYCTTSRRRAAWRHVTSSAMSPTAFLARAFLTVWRLRFAGRCLFFSRTSASCRSHTLHCMHRINLVAVERACIARSEWVTWSLDERWRRSGGVRASSHISSATCKGGRIQQSQMMEWLTARSADRIWDRAETARAHRSAIAP